MRRVEQWSKKEIAELPNAMSDWNNGHLNKAGLREMFKNRSVGAIKVKYNKLASEGKLRKLPIRHSVVTAKPGYGPLAWLKTKYEGKRELKLVEGDRIVTYREV